MSSQLNFAIDDAEKVFIRRILTTRPHFIIANTKKQIIDLSGAFCFLPDCILGDFFRELASDFIVDPLLSLVFPLGFPIVVKMLKVIIS